MSVLAIKGIYRNGVAVPGERLNIAESEVVIVFLQDLENDDAVGALDYYQKIAKSFDFGRKPDREYEKELNEIYAEMMSAQAGVAHKLGLYDED